jgi:hypothetical protein
MGLGRENITGILPLYLFQEHWEVAKNKIAPTLGYMCTLDIMGFKEDQQKTVPFLVLMKSLEMLQKEPGKEII